jgi:hypothetical protein
MLDKLAAANIALFRQFVFRASTAFKFIFSCRALRPKHFIRAVADCAY